MLLFEQHVDFIFIKLVRHVKYFPPNMARKVLLLYVNSREHYLKPLAYTEILKIPYP